MSFKGTYLNKFDEAGRVSLPAKMREELKANNYGNTLVIYYAFASKCLKILPSSVYDSLVKNFRDNPPKNPRQIKLFRGMTSTAADIEINSSGRISIPAIHRSKANLSDECYIVGMDDKIEVWNKEAWETEMSLIEDEFSKGDIDDGLDIMLF